MATEFFRVHGISEKKNIIVSKPKSRILKYILHKYINSDNFTKRKMIFKVLWPQNSNKTLQVCAPVFNQQTNKPTPTDMTCMTDHTRSKMFSVKTDRHNEMLSLIMK